jgi:hypothetical protein
VASLREESDSRAELVEMLYAKVQVMQRRALWVPVLPRAVRSASAARLPVPVCLRL